MSDLSGLPRWAQDKIAELEKELHRWQDLYIELARDRMRQDPVFVPIMSPADIETSPPKLTSDPPGSMRLLWPGSIRPRLRFTVI